jgi:putative redox protein
MVEAMLDAEQYWEGLQRGLEDGEILVTDSGEGPWGQVLLSRDHALFADEPTERQGRNAGPQPTQLVLMALGSCTTITVRMYAARKGWSISRIAVRLRYPRSESASVVPKKIERKIEIDGPLDTDQRQRLFAIAEKCPVHQMLSGGVAIESELLPAGLGVEAPRRG